MLQQARANNQFNVFGYLNHIRTQRNHLVQTEEQYVFIHDALLEAIRSGVTEISRENLASYLEDFLLRPATSGEFEAMEFLPNESLIEAQFRLVNDYIFILLEVPIPNNLKVYRKFMYYFIFRLHNFNLLSINTRQPIWSAIWRKTEIPVSYLWKPPGYLWHQNQG